MNKNWFHQSARIVLAAAVLAAMAASCTSPSEPETTPPEAQFVPNSVPPNPVDQGIFADVGPRNAIDVQWEPDSTGRTSGYLLYRSVGDSSVGSNGLLAHGTEIADLESSNFPLSSPPTSYLDTIGIVPGPTYYYQLQGIYRETNNSVNYGPPTHPGTATSFAFSARVQLLSPSGTDTLHGFPLQFLWQDPNDGGQYQIIVQDQSTGEYLWSGTLTDFGSPAVATYPASATPPVPGTFYQWRVKWLEQNGGSTSLWSSFTIQP